MNKESLGIISKLVKRINDDIDPETPKLKKTKLIELAMEIGLDEIARGDTIIFYDPHDKDWVID